ncbi:MULTISPECIES: ImmA/IrrE family metallo-endopeptidase [Kurthia]|uniref:ImmA/IrrE family metallo-endopeptidase n=1 Tax=Kurthia TaxID=1649 RepID=UPI000745B98D|nr:ImmA/IrrE family metallo-endopeptidase [Kurthia sp. 11kri321]AMA63345.1 hypothetical protein ASO14_1176 [Kurthia sp. 11kri321]
MYVTTHLEDRVNKILFANDLHSFETLNMLTVIKKFDLKVIESTHTFRAGKIIFLNKHATLTKQWEHIAHELSHILYDDGVQTMNKMYIDYREYQADLFAMYFTMPTHLLEQLPEFILNNTRYVASIFMVTEKFAQNRLNHFYNRLNKSERSFYK